MKKNIIPSIALCITTQLAFALPEKPTACPSVSAIKNTPITTAIELFGGYFASTMSNFGLEEKWIFTMGLIQANSEEQAKKKGQNIVQHLSGSPQPQKDSSGMEWSCQYQLPDGMGGMAVTTDDYPSPLELTSSLMNKRIE